MGIFNVPKGNNPAATQNPYNIMLRKMDAAGLIGVATQNKNGLMSANGFFAKITTLDVSELKTTGIYMNVNGTPTYYGLVIVFAYGDYVAQFFLAKDGASYVRNLNDSSWTSWVRFDK